MAGTRPGRALRVLIGLETSGPGGAEHMVLQLAEGLRALGVSVELATMQTGWMTERADRAGLATWIRAQRAGPDPIWVARLRSELRRGRFDLFHGHEFEMNAYGGLAAWLAGLPSVATLHGSVAGTDARHLLAYRVLGLLGQRTVAVSHELLEQLAPRLGRRRRTPDVIHNGTRVPARASLASRRERREQARRGLDLPSEGPLLLAVGNLYPVKDHATLLRAAAGLEGVRVAIAGRGEQEDSLRGLASELGIADRVHLLGLRDDVDRLLAAADVFVQPSRSEGLPMAILEALAAQTPVVATSVGGVGEAIEDGRNGLLVEPGRPDRLGAVLGRLLSDETLAERFASAGWQRAHDEFSIESMAAGYLSLYRRMLAR